MLTLHASLISREVGGGQRGIVKCSCVRGMNVAIPTTATLHRNNRNMYRPKPACALQAARFAMVQFVKSNIA
ncbi:Protein of unknown function [Pyronema omphalodes CBS 100304]|uniref:Uncharacterized protein n=1 Tax=Pyronema omphalodes (strain CBS 100304) TaxID=1076935 RepID=U4KZB4_PYROM|nr:Protein of unknown function [Pyronema omphalodes CBS 100304]